MWSRRPRPSFPRRPSPAGRAGAPERRASSCAPGSARGSRRSSCRPSRPVRSTRPAASRAATARNDVVVLPSVPVIPTTPSSWLGSPYHQAAASASAAGLRSDDELRQRDVRQRPLDDRCHRAGGGCLADELVAVDVARPARRRRDRPGCSAGCRRSRRGPRSSRAPPGRSPCRPPARHGVTRPTRGGR